jgi:serine/threonine-protein kinase
VSWDEAVAYCKWAKVRLPTEAEWERAARGTEGRLYPWGDPEPDPTRANYAHAAPAPTPVGLFPKGATPDGIQDLTGNVWELVADWYADQYPKQKRNPTGPKSGEERVLRGAGWVTGPLNLRALARGRIDPNRGSSRYAGFQ